MINKKRLIIMIIITFIIGNLFVPFVNYNEFNLINKPPFSPPKIVFPIVWTILFILMSIAITISYNQKNFKIYIIQLIFNSTWTLLFFIFKFYLVSIIWIIILLYFNKLMINTYNKKAKYLLIPYFTWLLIALYLNIGIYLLN